MIESILTSIKKNLGLEEDYEAFDPDITMHINSAFVTLNQLGVGPAEGFAIEDKNAEWVAFLGTDPRLNSVKTYITLRVRLIFDPPSTSYLIQSFQTQLNEIEWRLNTHREDIAWVDPNPTPMPIEEW